MNYSRFGLMILVSTVVMFGLMSLNNYALDHVYFSETRFYMALLMGASMAAVMLLFMLKMYTRKGVNWADPGIGGTGVLRLAVAGPQPVHH